MAAQIMADAPQLDVLELAADHDQDNLSKVDNLESIAPYSSTSLTLFS